MERKEHMVGMRELSLSFQTLSNCSRGIAGAAIPTHQQSTKDNTHVQAAIDAAAIT